MQHLVDLVKSGFYTNTAVFRVIDGFIAQWGISGDPGANRKPLAEQAIPDDPSQPGVSNRAGTVTFATAGPNTRTTLLFVNLADNPQLDMMGFTPIGELDAAGYATSTQLYGQYGEGAPQGFVCSPHPSRLGRRRSPGCLPPPTAATGLCKA